MNKKEVREKLEAELLKDPQYRDIVLAERARREASDERKTQKEFFEGMFRMMAETLKGVSDQVNSEKTKADAVEKSAVAVMAIAETLGSLMGSKEGEDGAKMIDEIAEVKGLLSDIKDKDWKPEVKVEAPIVEVTTPEPKVISETKIVQETKHIEQAVKILEGILEKVGNEVKIPSAFTVKNVNPKDAIPVTLTDKDQKRFQDLSEIAKNFLVASQNAPSQVSLKTVTGSLGTQSNPIYVDTELPAPAALADNTPNPTTTSVGAFLHGYDGATWDRMGGDSTNGLDVDVTRITQGIRAEVTGTGNALGQFPIAATDVSNYRWVSVWLNGGTLTCIFEGSNDNSNWTTVALLSTGATTSQAAINSANPSNAIFHGPINFKYFRVRVSAYTSGTVSAIAEFFMSPSGIQSIGATVLPGNTVNTSPWYVRQQLGTRSDTYTVTGNGTAINLSTASIPVKTFAVQVKGTGGAATLWNVSLEGSLNGTDYQELINHATADGDGVVKWTSDKPILHLRSRCSALTLGGATNIVVTILGMP